MMAVANHNVGAGRHQRRIGTQFGKHVIARVIRIEHHHHLLAGSNLRAHSGQRVGVNGAAVDQTDRRCERAGSDGIPILRLEIDLNADHAALLQQAEQARIEDQAACATPVSMRDVRLDRKDQVLHADQIFRQLNDGAAKPAERIDVPHVPAVGEPSAGDGRKALD